MNKSFSLIYMVFSFLLISCSEKENKSNDFEDNETTYSCASMMLKSSGKIPKMMDISPGSGFMDYYPNPQSKKLLFCFLWSLSYRYEFDSSIESMYIHARLMGKLDINLEF